MFPRLENGNYTLAQDNTKRNWIFGKLIVVPLTTSRFGVIRKLHVPRASGRTVFFTAENRELWFAEFFRKFWLLDRNYRKSTLPRFARCKGSVDEVSTFGKEEVTRSSISAESLLLQQKKKRNTQKRSVQRVECCYTEWPRHILHTAHTSSNSR